jgi:hypothetical protein
MSATDPRNEHPSEDSIPTHGRSRPRALRPSSTCSRDAGGASLDGDPPASVTFAHRLSRSIGAEASNTNVGARHRSVLAGAAIDSPSGGAPLAAAFSSAGRVGDVTSDVLCRARRGSSSPTRLAPREVHPNMRRSPGPLPRAVSSKTAASTNQDAFHRRVLPPPGRRVLPAHELLRKRTTRRTGPRREPATVLAASPPRAGFRRSFAHRS